MEGSVVRRGHFEERRAVEYTVSHGKLPQSNIYSHVVLCSFVSH